MHDQNSNTEEYCSDHGSTTDRRRFIQGCGAALAFAATGTSIGTATAEAEGDIATLLENLPDNWGRWGEDDELGAINFLDSTQVQKGIAALLGGEHGRPEVPRLEYHTLQLSMSGEIANDPVFPGRIAARRDNVRDERSYRDGEAEPNPGGTKSADDAFVNRLFLQGTTHADALGHAWYGDEIYNGFDALTTADEKEFENTVTGLQPVENDEDLDAVDVESTRGLSKADISNAASNGVVGRAVLLDVGREIGDSKYRLAEGQGITLSNLHETADAQNVSVKKRDILLIRTGSIERVRDPDAEWDPLTEPGLVFSKELVEWFYEYEIPYIGADNLAVEKVNQEIDGEEYVIPLHAVFLRNLGVTLNEILDLQGLGESCADDNNYEFLFTAAPLNIERATGAPVNPVVIKATN